jgi:hypothetical protein
MRRTRAFAETAPFAVALVAVVASALQQSGFRLLGWLVWGVAALLALLTHLAVGALARSNLEAEQAADAAVAYVNGLRGNGDPSIADLVVTAKRYEASRR